MGEVEQMRMNTPGTTKINPMFQPNRDLELSLIRDVETAQKNLDNYLERKKLYISQLKSKEKE